LIINLAIWKVINGSILVCPLGWSNDYHMDFAMWKG
jgi:hypothetical protein